MRRKPTYGQDKPIYLTRNERKALIMLLKDGRVSDADVGLNLKVTSQAASKIRKKLEKVGLIKKYIVDLSYSALGVQTFALALIDVSQEILSENKELRNYLDNNMIGLYRIIKNSATHVGIFAFKDLRDLDNYFGEINTRFGNSISIQQLHILPVDSVIKHSRSDLFKHTIKDFGNYSIPSIASKPLSKIKSNGKICKISFNEKKVLKDLLRNGRKPYGQMARELKNLTLTGRGISKIKERLEGKGIINGYTTNLDYKLLGIETFGFIFLKDKKNGLRNNESLNSLAYKSYNVIGCYRLNEKSMYVLFCGFRNLNELEHYHNELQKSNSFEIEKVFITSNKGVIKEDLDEAVSKIIC